MIWFGTFTNRVEERHLNSKGVLFGGKLLSWIDSRTSDIVHRLSFEQFVTAEQKTKFLKPVQLDQILSSKVFLVKTGQSSIVIKVMSSVDDVSVAESDLVFVRIDENFKPIENEYFKEPENDKL